MTMLSCHDLRGCWSMKSVLIATAIILAIAGPCNASIIDSVVRGATRATINNATNADKFDLGQPTTHGTKPASIVCSHVVLNSTAIRNAQFCQTSRISSYLDIEFVNSLVYRYFEVPASTFEALSSAPSAGRFFNQSIRNQYRCQRMSQTPRANASQGCD
jgi:hypothetical protein